LAKAAWVNDGGSVDEQYYRQQIKVVDEGWRWRACGWLPC